MNDFASEIKSAVNASARTALKLSAQELIRLSEPVVPVWTGKLRRTMRVKMEQGDVFVVAGDDTTPYAHRQYYSDLRHRGDVNKELLDLTALYRDAGGAKRRTGRGRKYLYARAYRLAIKNNAITKQQAPRWFERTIDKSETQQAMMDIFAGALKI